MREVYIDGRRTPLDEQPLASGGQAAVYAITGEPGRVVKIYHDLPDPDQQQRLTGMMRMSPLVDRATDGRQAPELAWPGALARDAGGTIVGYAMQRFGQPEHVPLAALFDRWTRAKVFSPELDWRFLLGVAWNLAYLTVRLHSEDIVVGDFSARNIVVDRDGFVTFLDCDSMAFEDPDDARYFPSEMHTPAYSAPERFARGGATRASDGFALAVCVFQLLTGGIHPFAGQPRGVGSVSVSMRSRISDGTSYVTQPQRIVMPKGTVSPGILPLPLFALAERAFSASAADPTTRPTPAEWFEALETTRGSVVSCAARTHHAYAAGLNSCPWCERLARQEPDLFASATLPAPRPSTTAPPVRPARATATTRSAPPPPAPRSAPTRVTVIVSLIALLVLIAVLLRVT
ncbi:MULTISPECIES: protein kinase [Streptomyces]|uniref:Protein kinase n=2 Tax=Streptomyces TaxID=1883 RepID=A0ABV9IFV2_9ACTN